MTISEAKLNWPTANRCRTKPHLLVIDDDVAVADTLVMVLNSEGFEARAVYRAEEGVELARSLEFDFLVTAVVMTQMNGIDAAIQIRKLLPKCKILLVSGDNDASALLQGAQSQGYRFEILPKPGASSRALPGASLSRALIQAPTWWSAVCEETPRTIPLLFRRNARVRLARSFGGRFKYLP